MAEILILMWLCVILVAGSGFVLGYLLGNINGFNRGMASNTYAEDYVKRLYEIGEETRR